MPPEYLKYKKSQNPDCNTQTIQGFWDSKVQYSSPIERRGFMRRIGVTCREVYARGSDMLQYREFTLGGYLNNPNAWPHFINQRARDPHTQLEMRELATMIEEVLK
jgi:hypothetical protein